MTRKDTENEYIEEYAEKYANKLINIRSNPVKKRKYEYNMTMKTDKQVRKRIGLLEKKLEIKDNTINELFYYDTIIDGKRHKTMARYGKTP